MFHPPYLIVLMFTNLLLDGQTLKLRAILQESLVRSSMEDFVLAYRINKNCEIELVVKLLD